MQRWYEEGYKIPSTDEGKSDLLMIFIRIGIFATDIPWRCSFKMVNILIAKQEKYDIINLLKSGVRSVIIRKD